MLKQFFILIVALLWGSISNGQFTTTGSAVQTGACQVIVTPDNPNQVGSFYSTSTVSLLTNFTLQFSVNFGCDNFGGEGLVFVMRTGAWTTGLGTTGNMGYGGMTGNSMGIEFDTYDNSVGLGNYDDGADHIGIFKNGSTNHDPSNTNNLSGSPVNIKPGDSDVEDCNFHLVEISWTAGPTQTIQVKVDGAAPSITLTNNFITTVFGGSTNVTWGWTGATSALDNEQIVGLALEPDFTISPTNCPGQLINFTDASTGYNTIVDWDWDFDGLGASSLQNPSFTFATAGSYDVTLTVTDDEGCTNTQTIPVGVGFEVLPTADASPICPGSSTQLHANAAPYVGNNCCFKLVPKDAWGDGWGGGGGVDSLTLFVDGAWYANYTAVSAGGGTPTADTINLCFDQGTVIDIEVVCDGPDFEASYLMLNESGTIVAQNTGGAAWVNGSTQTFTVDCGLTPPAYTYSWDNAIYLGGGANLSDPTATIPSTTTFTVTVTDPATGCAISAPVTVATSPPVTATISGNQTVCTGSSANLQINFTGTPPFSATVNGPGGPYNLTGISTLIYNFSVTLAGSYTLTAAAGNGCTGTFSGTGTLTVITPPTVDIAASASYCDGDAIAPLTVLSGGTGTVNWYNNPGLTGPPLGVGLAYTPTQGVGTVTYYAATTESVLGCVGPSDNVTITVHPIPTAPVVSGPTTYCEGDTPSPLTATATLGGTITWYDNPPPATVLSTLNSYNPTLTVGIFTLYVTETANGCEGPASPVTITVKPTPDAPTVAGDILYCEGDSPTALTATPTLGGTISWENSLGVNVATGPNFTPPLTNGFTTYTVFETLNGCQGPDATVTIEVQPAPSVSVTPQVSICIGDSILITALNNGYDITWSDGQDGEAVYLGPDTTTTYYVTATNPLCGFAIDSIKIIVNYLPDVIAGNDTLIGIGGEVTLWAESDQTVTYSWSPEPAECLNDDCTQIYDVPDQATVYVVTVTNQIGCQNSDTVLVDINGYMEVFVPNIFSPNGDGQNDYLVVHGPRLFNYYIQVYDRWGKLVFESDEQKQYWDGTLNGEELAPQTFVYMLSGESVLGEKIVKEGNVTIIE